MNMKNKIGTCLAIIMALFFATTMIISTWDFTLGKYGVMRPVFRDYTLTGTDVSIYLDSYGRMSVHEEIGYTLKGCYRELFRQVDIAREPDRGNNEPYITSINTSCSPNAPAEDRGNEATCVYGNICDTNAKLADDFEILRGVVVGADVAELHYKVWGSEWDKSLMSLKGEITLPQGSRTDKMVVYFNPLGVVDDYHFERNVLKFRTGRVDDYLEVRILMPKDTFNDTGSTRAQNNFRHNDALKKAGIVKIQEDYASKYAVVQYTVTGLMIILIIAMIVFPVWAYRKYGTEPKTGYNAVFEREPVKGVKPYVVNSICGWRTGDTDANAVTATLLDLIRRKHIELSEVMTSKKLLFVIPTIKKDMMLKFAKNVRDSMTKPEQEVYDFFKSFANSKSEMRWSELVSAMKIKSDAKKYMKLIKDFEKAVDADYDLKKYFEKKGSSMMTGVCAALFALSAIIIFITAKMGFEMTPANYPATRLIMPVAVIMIIYSVVGLILPTRIFGRFTPEGHELYMRSMNFKKFMTDMTQLRKYPPKSIVIWEEILVYATLFGVAEKVTKEMKVVVNDKMIHGSSLYVLSNAGMMHSLNAAQTTAAASLGGGAGGGGGGAGGGFGGGGGGAR
jgi:uncharacterized membrane protein